VKAWYKLASEMIRHARRGPGVLSTPVGFARTLPDGTLRVIAGPRSEMFDLDPSEVYPELVAALATWMREQWA
jgi:hypothetical protein